MKDKACVKHCSLSAWLNTIITELHKLQNWDQLHILINKHCQTLIFSYQSMFECLPCHKTFVNKQNFHAIFLKTFKIIFA